MKQIIKKYLSSVLVVIIVFINMLLPSAHSFLYDYEINHNSIYYENKIEVNTKVLENISNSSKSNIRIQNIGSSPCYIKAMVVFTPIDKQGLPLTNIEIDRDNDIQIEWNNTIEPGGAWLAVPSSLVQNNHDFSNQHQDLYPYIFFYKSPLLPKQATENLIDSLVITTETYDIRVDILVDAIYEADITQWCDIYGLNCDTTNRILSN